LLAYRGYIIWHIESIKHPAGKILVLDKGFVGLI